MKIDFSMIFKIFVASLILYFFGISIFEDKIEANRSIDCIITWIGLAGWGFGAFLIGAKPYADNPNSKKSYIFAVLSVFICFTLIPVLSLLTWSFPPRDLSVEQTIVAFIGFIISLFGPLLPSVINYISNLFNYNKQLRQKTTKRKISK